MLPEFFFVHFRDFFVVSIAAKSASITSSCTNEFSLTSELECFNFVWRSSCSDVLPTKGHSRHFNVVVFTEALSSSMLDDFSSKISSTTKLDLNTPMTPSTCFVLTWYASPAWKFDPKLQRSHLYFSRSLWLVRTWLFNSLIHPNRNEQNWQDFFTSGGPYSGKFSSSLECFVRKWSRRSFRFLAQNLQLPHFNPASVLWREIWFKFPFVTSFEAFLCFDLRWSLSSSFLMQLKWQWWHFKPVFGRFVESSFLFFVSEARCDEFNVTWN